MTDLTTKAEQIIKFTCVVHGIFNNKAIVLFLSDSCSSNDLRNSVRQHVDSLRDMKYNHNCFSSPIYRIAHIEFNPELHFIISVYLGFYGVDSSNEDKTIPLLADDNFWFSLSDVLENKNGEVNENYKNYLQYALSYRGQIL